MAGLVSDWLEEADVVARSSRAVERETGQVQAGRHRIREDRPLQERRDTCE